MDLTASCSSCRATYARDEVQDIRMNDDTDEAASVLADCCEQAVFRWQDNSAGQGTTQGASRGRCQLNDRWGAMGPNTGREGLIVNCVSLCLSVSARFPNKITISRAFTITLSTCCGQHLSLVNT